MMLDMKKIPIYIDLVFCFILLPLMFMLLPVERWYATDSVYVYLLIVWFYIVYLINRCISVSLLFRKKSNIKLLTLIMILITIIGTYLFTKYQFEIPNIGIRKAKDSQMPKLRMQQQAVWFLYIVVMTFSIAVGLLTELYREIMLRQSIEFEKKKAELALYKAQINPHFLFNTLNTLYGMIVTTSEHMETTFIKFINLMKYMYSNSSNDKISVQTEIEYIEQYIDLQKYRIPEHTHVFFSYEHDETSQMEISPMILITFIENAFKYGVSSIFPSDIYIVAKAENGEIMFSVQNTILNIKKKKESSGIGIENCKRRLELLYHKQHALEITNTGNIYSVVLTIKL